MKDTYYFSHDYNTRTDVKIKRIIAKHGMLGYGVFWAIIEDLYNNANALPTDYESIAFDLRTNEMIVKSIINDFDLFIIENELFGSMSVQRRIDERNEKSTKARESANKRWNKQGQDANALQSESEPNAIKESKENKSKGKESKIKDFIFLGEFENIKIESDKETELRNRYPHIKLEAMIKKIDSWLQTKGKKCNSYKGLIAYFNSWVEEDYDSKNKPSGGSFFGLPVN